MRSLLGKPVEGYRLDRLIPLLQETGNFPLTRYICRRYFSDGLIRRLNIRTDSCWADCLAGYSPSDDDTNYTVFALKLVEEYGPDFTPDDVLEGWLSWLPIFATCTAERAAYCNAAQGMTAPAMATWQNPYREWIGARGSFRLHLPGRPWKGGGAGLSGRQRLPCEKRHLRRDVYRRHVGGRSGHRRC